jgi:hypothetical protein
MLRPEPRSRRLRTDASGRPLVASLLVAAPGGHLPAAGESLLPGPLSAITSPSVPGPASGRSSCGRKRRIAHSIWSKTDDLKLH